MITQTVSLVDLSPFIQGAINPVWQPVLFILGVSIAALLLMVLCIWIWYQGSLHIWE